MADLERWRDRIHQAIDQGYVIEYGTNKQITLDEINGINILGDILEASALSPNQVQFYIFDMFVIQDFIFKLLLRSILIIY